MSFSENVADCEGTLVISCGEVTPESIICKILQVESLPEAVTSKSNLKGYSWSFTTKYYSSKINLFAVEEKVELDPTFSESIKAVIFYFDSKKLSSFEDVLSWMDTLKNIDTEVQLLVCNNCLDECDNPALERKSILKWCVENQYELVELNPSPENEDEDDENFKSAKGYDRVIEALQSYTWANLVMKDEKFVDESPKKESAEGIRESEDAAKETKSSVSENNKDSSSSEEKGCKTMNVDGEELGLEEHLLNNVLNGEDPGGESFEALFSKFASMKEKAAGLNNEEKKKYAEKVAIAFWRAMGGDEDEIEGLDDSE
ncbi:alpha- and gamma-adaptin-binding protein p34 [Trichonephila inaurata madagascariensis]|uniref:Alpha- and gamma-adaptin-binding protein p34 n=1 Tax=Trichonephila inaurata madagascariensis TaxID=2747483 RepID=A0A8X7BVI7_9ARAC|nr:alpha- and gamma-adaptin-binding protein p34 [Trichonephila inaurata madagascariensis]